uniref:Uncharacterized protein n=1 Tax=Oryza nivara TaxID=4536 RepID=A0A0E0I7L5_ORYNI
MKEETAVADWSALPEDVIITVMGCLSVLGDLVRSGAVCSTWRDAYATFRRLHLPSTTAQPPWLLYACDAHGPAAAALYCPATGKSLRAWSTGCRHAIYDDADGLFYTLRYDGFVYAIDVPRAAAASSPPATREVMRSVTNADNGSKYLVRVPCSGDLLQVWRFVNYDNGDEVEEDEDAEDLPLGTKHLQIFKVDGVEQKLVEASAASLEDHVLFLGHGFSACFPAEHFPALKPGCAYLADDHELVSVRKHCRRDIGRWDMKRGQMEKLSGEDDVAAPSQPWLNWPTPVWITPTFY